MYVIVTDDILDLLNDDVICIQTCVETRDVLDYLKNSFNDSPAEAQTKADIPREKLMINNKRIRTIEELESLYGGSKLYETILLCTNQALISYPYILFQNNVPTHILSETKDMDKMIIVLNTFDDGMTVKVIKKLRLLEKDLTGNDGDPKEVFKFKLIFSFNTKDKFSSIECKRVREYTPLNLRYIESYHARHTRG